MHRLIYIFSFLLIGFSVYSQQYVDSHNPKEIKSLLSKKNTVNGFGSVDAKITEIKGERTLITGAYGSIFVNHFFMLGIGGYGLVTRPEFVGELPDGTPKSLRITGGYAGMLFGAKVFSREVLHLSFPVFLGGGAVQVSDPKFFPSTLSDTDFTIERSLFYLIEPGAELEVNITNNLRLALGVTYRFVKDVELRNLSDDDLTNWSGLVSFKFGRF